MKKVFKLEELDCAHCAQKMEDEIRRIESVTGVQVNFLSQKLTLEADDSCFDEVLKKVEAVVRKVEPDCRIITK